MSAGPLSPSYSRSSSQSSAVSAASSVRPISHYDLEFRAQTILTSLCNDRDFSVASSYISDSVVVQHDDNPPSTSLDSFLSRWKFALQKFPDFHIEIKEACVDDVQRKVWVRSHMTGVGLSEGLCKESIDMMSFDESGMLINSVDCQRVKRLGNDDD